MADNTTEKATKGGDSHESQAVHTDTTAAASTISRNLHDPNVTFEEYLYWAKISRADERYENPIHNYTLFGRVLKKGRHPDASHEDPTMAANQGPTSAATGHGDEKALDEKSASDSSPQRRFVITDDEYVTASRAVRNATWGAVFYLITTDILGPFSVPWALAAVSTFPSDFILRY